MNGLAEAEEQRGERKDFKGRERNYREEKRGGGLAMGERWQDIEVSERGKWESAIEGESERKKKTEVQKKIVIQRESKQSKMTGPRYTQAKEDEKVTESRF